ncbi:MAG: hypothetical protein Q4P84_08065, partial [Elusimicrobiales bacterium]|nr:hypothetical protein [Elusimicrobiales bacterium]
MEKKALTSALISASMLVSSFSGLCVFAADAAPFSYSDGRVTVSKIDGYDSAAIIVAKYADGDALSEVKITNAASFPVTVDAAVGDKVMVWNSVDGETGMKPIADTFTVSQPVDTEKPTENVTKVPETEKPTETVTGDPATEYTVSIGTVTGAEGANIYIVNPAAPTNAPTPTPAVTATPNVTQAPTLPPVAENTTKFTVDASTSVAAGAVYSDDAAITVKTEFLGKVGNTAATIGDISYTNNIQIRIDGADPHKGEYTAKADCTPLLITAKKSGTFTIYYRRQTPEGYTVADGKDIKL